jgi:hypothetical protein
MSWRLPAILGVLVAAYLLQPVVASWGVEGLSGLVLLGGAALGAVWAAGRRTAS